MKYFVLLTSYGEMPVWSEQSPEEQQVAMQQHGAFSTACAAAPDVELLYGEALDEGSTSSTLRTRSGTMTVTDGPFAEVAEQVGGFYVIDAPVLDTLIELCKVLPAYDIDIRPIIDVG